MSTASDNGFTKEDDKILTSAKGNIQLSIDLY